MNTYFSNNNSRSMKLCFASIFDVSMRVFFQC